MVTLAKIGLAIMRKIRGIWKELFAGVKVTLLLIVKYNYHKKIPNNSTQEKKSITNLLTGVIAAL